MQRSLNLLFVIPALLLVSTSLPVVRMSAHANLNQQVLLSGQGVSLVQKVQLLHATDTSQPLSLSIGLQMRNAADFDNLLQQIYDPQSAQYRHYLTPDQFNQLFAPTVDQVQQVVSYLQSQGLSVTSVAPNNLLIDATSSVGQAQQAFHTQINTYRMGGHTFFANTTPPSIPVSLSSLIASINGLDNSVQYHPLYHRGQLLPQAGPTKGYGAKDLEGAYDVGALHGTNILGDNQTVAVFELDGYQTSDVTQYFQYYNLGNPHITNVLVDGFNGAAGQGALEVSLDIEVVAAMAPHANQIVYEGPNTTQGLNDTYNKIVTDNKAQIATVSWGLCERSSGASELQTLDTILKQGAAEGISFFAASGDSGAYDCADSSLAVDSPASDPYVTSVGGTNLQLNGGVYGSESVWSDSSTIQRGPKGAGGGGGMSNTFKQPNWQRGSGVQNQYSDGFREVPDVTADADPNTGYAVYCTVPNAGCPGTGWLSVGGTSGSAPLWAGSTALFNQYLQAQGKARLGYANPSLYSLFNSQQPYPAFHDVTNGNNLFYAATTNYDLASGLGSPDIYNMARDLVSGSASGTPTPIPSPTPTDTPTATPTPTPPPPPPLIKNGDFENGQAPWQESSVKGYQIIDQSNAYSGMYSAYLCGYPGCDDRIWQSFAVPTNYTKITITYWWYSDTNKTVKQCLDNFTSQLQNSGNAIIRVLQQNCNSSVSNNWVQESFDVSSVLAAYKGKTVTLLFHGTNTTGQPQTSDFIVDAVGVTIS